MRHSLPYLLCIPTTLTPVPPPTLLALYTAALDSLSASPIELVEDHAEEGSQVERKKSGRTGRKALEQEKKELVSGKKALLDALPCLASSSGFFHVSYVALDASSGEVFGSPGGVGVLIAEEGMVSRSCLPLFVCNLLSPCKRWRRKRKQ